MSILGSVGTISLSSATDPATGTASKVTSRQSSTASASASGSSTTIAQGPILVTVTASDGATNVIIITATVSSMAASTCSSSAAATSQLIPSYIPAPYIFDVSIDGETYSLPSPSEQTNEILLLDGSVAQLAAGKVTLRGQILNIPASLSADQEISAGGQTIKAAPGKTKKPNAGGGGGIGGLYSLFEALSSLVGAAGSVKYWFQTCIDSTSCIALAFVNCFWM
ncbi:hypothetical protein BDV96DRAFT_646378 [Lophiotrema nucula]|uniref:Uncharacterized protein n=1 Tax=Lophiotrema nucula TaxID=690887 RepID=A0A6A5Z8U4_9PLEO|nr:hypothetical protein BDV96DRAFT_646378 [Lophiotrema nucula]